MPLYHYQALDPHGKKRTGLIEAHDEREAKLKLRDQGVMVSKLKVRKGAATKENLKGEQLQTFTIQLSQLVNAGLPVYESLLALEEQYRNEAFHRILLSLCDKIKGGARLSEAMASYPGSFDFLYCSMIDAGESSGALDVVLEKLSDLIAKQNKLKRELTTAMIYPSILAGFAILVITLLLGFVVPVIEGIFQGRELNAFTNFVISASYYFRAYWWIYLPLIILALTTAVYQLRTPAGKEWLEKQCMRLPVIKKIMVQAALVRFTRTMGTLQKGGLTMIDSLKIARGVMGNRTMQEEIKKAESNIVEGSSLSQELSHSKWIPFTVSRMLAVGEDAGNTEVMFNKIADMYEQDLEKSISRGMALIQPIILMVMGSIILVVMLSILLPMTDISFVGM